MAGRVQWRVFGVGLLGGLLGWAGAAAAACDVRSSKDPGRATDCPACVCKCETASGAPAGPLATVPAGPGADVQELIESAMRKMNRDDGTGCLSDLDAYDRMVPRRKSSDPQNTLAMTRAQCVMLAGQCEAGKLLLRGAYENTAMAKWGPEQLERSVEQLASMHCRGKMSPRDELLQGMMSLSMGANLKRMSVGECDNAYQQVRRNRDKVQPRDDDDHQVVQARRDLYAIAPGCFGRAGDCVRARKVFNEGFPLDQLKEVKDPKVRADAMTSTFEAMVPKCKR